MRKKLLAFPLIAAIALSCAVSACASPYTSSDDVSSVSASFSEIIPFSLGNSVTCKNNSGNSDPFEIHEAGRVRFYFTNNTDSDIVITIHKKGIFGIWGGAVTVNGKSEFKVPANDSVEFDTNGSKMASGTYRCEASNEDGKDFDYVCALRELDYTP
jgi:hypothetical protein